MMKKIAKYDMMKLTTYFNNEKLSDLHKMKSQCDDRYYNSGEDLLLTDEQYDLLKEIIIKREDKNYVTPIGAKISNHQEKITLPYHLGSMTKLKADDDIAKWARKHIASKYVIEEKLDGVSCLFICNNKNISIYTRGDGTIGTNISHLSKYIQNIPKKLPDIILRGELIIKTNTFISKYKDEFANPRNMVSGLVNSQTIRKGTDDIDFVAYEIIDSELTPLEQLQRLKKLGISHALFNTVSAITKESLSQLLTSMKLSSAYDIDGIIVQPNSLYTRNTSGNPDYAFAFKMNTETAITEVEKVIWNISKHKMLKPTIQLKPINLNGVLISFTTGFNAKYIKDNNLGPGSLVEITRSGDVIPYIVNIIKSSDKADMPESPFAWNETNTDILVLNDKNNVSDIKKIASLFSELKIKYVSEATITKMFEYGLNDLFKILSATVDDFLKIETFGNTMAEKIYNNIHDGLKNISVPLLCGAFSIFGLGMGKRKMNVLFDSVPDLFDLYHSLSTDALISKLNTVEGFSQKSSEKIVQNLPLAIEFVNKITPFVTFKSSSPVNECCNMENMIFVCSGFRDLALEEYITSKGGQVKTSVSKNTTCVIVKDTSTSSAKIVKAKDLNISILTTEEFFKNF